MTSIIKFKPNSPLALRMRKHAVKLLDKEYRHVWVFVLRNNRGQLFSKYIRAKDENLNFLIRFNEFFGGNYMHVVHYR